MIIKHQGFRTTALNRFDLLGSDEVGLSKAFAYLLAVDPPILFRFLRELGVQAKHTDKNVKNTTIHIERKRHEGRTDIEIHQTGKYHLIVECKVGRNRIKKQRTQYRSCFADEAQKVLCFITQERDCNREVAAGISIHYKGWLDVIGLINAADISRSEVVREFAGYVTRGFKMRDQKEILVQDLSRPREIKRYTENNVYRRDVTFGSPLYFAPYFTKGAKQPEGIVYLSKVLGVLTVRPQDVLNFKDELLLYADKDTTLVKKWLAGIGAEKSKEPHTYYFLAEPVSLNNPLLKDGGRKKGRGKNWIAAMIPKNRCVTFEEFTKRIMMANKALLPMSALTRRRGRA